MVDGIKNWDDFRAMLRGKLFLVGLNILDTNAKVTEKYQTAGVVEDLTDDGFFLLRRTDGSLFTIPYEPKTIEAARKGEYILKSTGETITDPDYLTTWDVKLNASEVANFKARGFVRTSPDV
jgi:hypothetical protein